MTDMRFMLRFFSLVALALAVGVAGLDSVRSIARSMPDLTTAQSALTSLRPEILPTSVAIIDGKLYGDTVATALRWVLVQPLFALLLVLSLIFWIVGYKKVPAAGRFAA